MRSWLPVPGWEHRYEVSDGGCVRSKDMQCRTARDGLAIRRGRVIKATPKTNGYLVVTLAEPGRREQRCIHELVCLAFLGPRPRGQQVCHRDDNEQNNTLENLRYDTPAGNNADAIANGLKPRGERHGCAKLTEADAIAIRSSRESSSTLAHRYGIDPSHVWSVRSGRTWRHLA